MPRGPGRARDWAGLDVTRDRLGLAPAAVTPTPKPETRPQTSPAPIRATEPAPAGRPSQILTPMQGPPYLRESIPSTPSRSGYGTPSQSGYGTPSQGGYTPSQSGYSTPSRSGYSTPRSEAQYSESQYSEVQYKENIPADYAAPRSPPMQFSSYSPPKRSARKSVAAPHEADNQMNRLLSGGFVDGGNHTGGGLQVEHGKPQGIAEVDPERVRSETKARGLSRNSTPADSIQGVLHHQGPTSSSRHDMTHAQKKQGRYSDASYWDRVKTHRGEQTKTELSDLVTGRNINYQERPKTAPPKLKPEGNPMVGRTSGLRTARPEPTGKNPLTGTLCKDWSYTGRNRPNMQPSRPNPIQWQN